MIVLEGLPALSPFRRDRLETRLQTIAPTLRLAGAWFTYWVQPESGRTPDAGTLQRVLEAHGDHTLRADGAVSRFVAPRLGTISPWASKASRSEERRVGKEC